MKSVCERLVDRWKTQGLSPLRVATTDAIVAFERRNGVLLPEDFRSYLLLADGMDDGTLDDQFFCFWGLSRLENINSDCEGVYVVPLGGRDFFMFADYLIWSYAYAIDLGIESATRERIIRVGGAEVVADTFSEFVEFYLLDSPRLHSSNQH